MKRHLSIKCFKPVWFFKATIKVEKWGKWKNNEHCELLILLTRVDILLKKAKKFPERGKNSPQPNFPNLPKFSELSDFAHKKNDTYTIFAVDCHF